MNPARRLGFIIAGITFLADQALKWLVMGPLALPERLQIDLVPFFRLTWAENRGVSLGMFTAESDAGRWSLVALTALISIGVVVWMLREKARGDILALGLVLGGALGNIVDRVRFGYVADYADLHFGEFRPFMIFNLADAAISIGVLIVLARSLLSREKAADQPAGPASES
ncbi:signal peptidase II [Novosphingobium sp. TH158]|uniref:signal peptidase II n=1 Tax=Novosphingobium sp. TH158 TaxID=2067455 RepID=UPI000C7DF291|nr:signal peptidase II [Novosphingobium sp. TH158]PLK27052.1 signal peptidase II [Novosphingobium sp. TH158]